jgi:hypothetical protein
VVHLVCVPKGNSIGNVPVNAMWACRGVVENIAAHILNRGTRWWLAVSHRQVNLYAECMTEAKRCVRRS